MWVDHRPRSRTVSTGVAHACRRNRVENHYFFCGRDIIGHRAFNVPIEEAWRVLNESQKGLSGVETHARLSITHYKGKTEVAAVTTQPLPGVPGTENGFVVLKLLRNAADAPDRGKVTDEYIDAFRLLWSEHSPRFNGQYTKIEGIVLEPKPVQKPHPPIWVGGEGPAALRRAARIGNAWYPIGSNNAHLLDTLPRLKAGIAKLRKATSDAGRDPASVEVAFRVKRYGAAVPAKASDGERRLFSGSEADLIGDLRALKEMGVTAIDIDFGRPSADAVIAEMKRFRKAVIDKI